MARKAQTNPQFDMTPMIDVVFELIIFFVVTLTESAKKDESITLADGRHGMVITAETLPMQHLEIDVAAFDKKGEGRKPLKKPRYSIADRDLSLDQIQQVIKERQKRWGHEFPVLIRADERTPHDAIRLLMDKCTEAGIWKISFTAVAEDNTSKQKR